MDYKNKGFKSYLTFISVPFGLVIIAMLKFSTYLYNMILLRSDKEEMADMLNLGEEKSIIEKEEQMFGNILRKWAKHTPKKAYKIVSADGLELFGTAYMQKEFTHKWTIVLHGYSGYGEQMHSITKQFYEEGFNVLVPDLRGHGKSQGDYIGMGWHDRLDLINWIDKINDNDKNSRIILFGQSMGAAAVLMASGEDLHHNVKCIIEECGYTSVRDEFKYHLKKIYKIPSFPLLPIMGLVCRLYAGYNFSHASTIKQVAKCKIPILFIHGEKDTLVPTEMVFKLYNAAKCPKDILIIESAGHAVASTTDKDLYWNKIHSFIRRHYH